MVGWLVVLLVGWSVCRWVSQLVVNGNEWVGYGCEWEWLNWWWLVLNENALCEAVPSHAGPWVDRFLNNEIYCYPLSKKRCRPPWWSPPARQSEGIVTSGRQQRNGFVGWLVGWLVGRSVGQSDGWMDGWLWMQMSDRLSQQAMVGCEWEWVSWYWLVVNENGWLVSWLWVNSFVWVTGWLFKCSEWLVDLWLTTWMVSASYWLVEWSLDSLVGWMIIWMVIWLSKW